MDATPTYRHTALVALQFKFKVAAQMSWRAISHQTFVLSFKFGQFQRIITTVTPNRQIDDDGARDGFVLFNHGCQCLPSFRNCFLSRRQLERRCAFSFFDASISHGDEGLAKIIYIMPCIFQYTVLVLLSTITITIN
jgi:hypothetical protein